MKFGRECNDIRQNLFNFEHPMAEADIDGVNYRIGNGMVDWEVQKKTYILYKDGEIFGIYYSLNEAKEAVKPCEKE
jgi:hypothetical protein